MLTAENSLSMETVLHLPRVIPLWPKKDADCSCLTGHTKDPGQLGNIGRAKDKEYNL